MGVEVARGTAKLGGEGDALQLVELPPQTVGKDTPLLAQRGGRGGLAVGVSQHGYVFPFLSFGFEQVQQVTVGRQQHLRGAVFHAQRHTGVVDVLRGETEVDELFKVGEPHLVKLAFEEVFHRLDIVVGGLLYLLDGEGVLVAEVAVDVAQRFGFAGYSGQLRALCLELFGQSDEVLHFDSDTVFYQRPFREVGRQGFAFAAVAPIDRRDSVQCVHYRLVNFVEGHVLDTN